MAAPNGVSAAVARENGILVVPVEELFAKADYLTLHVGLTPQTHGIINAKTLATMKKGARIINCARGELVDEAALVAALKSGRLAGAALDVLTVEPPRDSPFFGLDNVILTPHIAGSTAEAQEAVGVQIAMQVREYLKLGVVQNAVNLPSLSHEEYVKLAPYIDLAGKLGAFLAQAGKVASRPSIWFMVARWPRPKPNCCATRPSPACWKALKTSIALTPPQWPRNAASVSTR